MGIFNKIKNVLFTEEEETTEIPLIQKEEVVPVKEEIREEKEEETSRFNNFKLDEDLTSHNEVKEPVVEEKKEEVRVHPHHQERSPFQSFDEEEFDRIAAINKNRLLERDRRAREEKERLNRYSIKEETKVEVRLPKEEPHKFKPTPVISPVYGILDKNYTKDDILPTASSEGTLPKIIDVDAVRQKAFGTLEKNIEDDSLDNIKITSYEDDKDNKDDLVIPDIEAIEEVSEITAPLPKIEDVEKELEQEVALPTREEVKEDKIESDLFNLIDSMYQEEGDN